MRGLDISGKEIGELAKVGSSQRRKGRRTKFELVACVLRKTIIPIRKTGIMYGCNLSFATTDDLLDILITNDLIETDSVSRLYQTTKKGCEFLKYYDALSQMLQTKEMIITWSRTKLTTTKSCATIV